MPARVPDDYWTVPQAAKLAGVTRETVHRWIKAGRLKAFKIAGIQPTLVRRDALAELLKPEER
jgi:excisionase family DNA binding protein